MKKFVGLLWFFIFIAVAGAAWAVFSCHQSWCEFLPWRAPAENTNTVPLQMFQTDDVRLQTPLVGQAVKSPLSVKGEVRGNWFFEATFPVKLIRTNGTVIAAGTAQAQSDYMTADFVAFKAVLIFATPTSSAGFLVLQKDNPSGLPQNALEARVPVQILGSPKTAGTYAVSGQVVRSPICPVERPGDPRCAPQGYATEIQISIQSANQFLKKIVTDANGMFQTALAPGNYIFQAGSGNIFPRCPALQVVVSTTNVQNLKIDCDTGIR